MSETNYHQRNKDIILKRAKEYLDRRTKENNK